MAIAILGLLALILWGFRMAVSETDNEEYWDAKDHEWEDND